MGQLKGDRMKEKLKACFDRLQKLQLPPTKNNMEILLQTLYDLQEIYLALKEDDADDGPANRAE